MTKADITGALPWLVAAAAVFVTHLLSEARERRKELRLQLDKVVERLLALESRSKRFHMAEAFNEEDARWIEAEVSRLEKILQRSLVEFSERLAEALTVHKRALTLSNFTRDAFVQQGLQSEIVTAIVNATVDYEEEIESAYAETYPKTFPYFSLGNRGITEAARALVAFLVGLLIGGVVVYLHML